MYFYLYYRQIKDDVKGHRLCEDSPFLDYNTISGKTDMLDIKINDNLKEIKDNYIIPQYTAGIKVVNRGHWMNEK